MSGLNLNFNYLPMVHEAFKHFRGEKKFSSHLSFHCHLEGILNHSVQPGVTAKVSEEISNIPPHCA